jgi:negative regulator of sigma E activity
MAGDTPTAQAVAGHLAGCPACTEELGRLQRSAALVRETVRALPPADLRSRTLAAVRAEGVLRPLPVVAAGPAIVPTPEPETRPASSPVPLDRRRRLVPVLGWVATVAAAVTLSVVATSFLVGSRVDSQLAAQAVTIEGLQKVTNATLTVTAQPDAQRVALANPSDPDVYGGITYSPSTAELVVVASGLTPPPGGQEYRCWVEIDGTRQRVGKMFFTGDLAFWVGPTPAISGVSSGATFGVSLVDAAGSAVDTDPVLVGEL